ncbi:E3 ubiquitin-protein ligase TRIM56-like [Apostichopus japonicus]|uniref:E3 ubiquitin-protein ligase TRIM56-like n=1 Tax=Stichopus japonicus TaxID=307972 RepID=UPI003AB15EB1
MALQANGRFPDAELLRCTMCMNRFKLPKILPCAHSFCQGCLMAYQSKLADQPFSCPTCRLIIDVPESGVRGFPSNVCFINLAERLDFFEQLTAQAGKAQKCNFCQKDEIVAFCLECSIAVCVTCQKGHSRLPGMKLHSVIRIEKVTDPKYMAKIAIVKAPYCWKHQREKFRYYCTVCNKLVCRDCTILDHRDHECIEAKRQAPDTREDLEALLEQADQQMENYVQHIKTGKEGIENIESKAREQCQNVEETFEAVVKTLRSNRDALCSQIMTIREKKVASVQNDVREAAKWVKSMRNAQTVTRKIVEVNNPWEILAMKESLSEAFETYRREAERRKNWGYNELDLSASFSPAFNAEEMSSLKIGDTVEESLVLLNYDPVKNQVVRQYVTN